LPTPAVAGGLVGVERNDAADADGQRRVTSFERRNAKAGNSAISEVDEALDVAVGQRLRVGYVDRDRRLLKVGLTLGGGDDDVAEDGRRGSRIVLAAAWSVFDRCGTGCRLRNIIGLRRCRLIPRRLRRRPFLRRVGRTRHDLRVRRHCRRSH
jgi:hypothetical protein